MVENIYIIQLHPQQALIETGKQILAASPVSVGARPHLISGFCTDKKLVPVGMQLLLQNPAEIAFRASGSRAVIVGQVKMRNAVIEGREDKALHIFKIGRISKIVPQSKRNSGKLKSASAAALVFHRFITVYVWLVHGNPPYILVTKKYKNIIIRDYKG